MIVSRRALHEIYMPAFESAVSRASVASVMCAYSTVNGNYSCQNPFLETTTLRDLWKVPGFVTSDYGAPKRLRVGRASIVAVRLTRSGNETLGAVRLSLQVPQGWAVRPLGRTVFLRVRPGPTPRATFMVTPPSWAPDTNAVVHATADLSSAAQRGAGVTVAVRR